MRLAKKMQDHCTAIVRTIVEIKRSQDSLLEQINLLYERFLRNKKNTCHFRAKFIETSELRLINKRIQAFIERFGFADTRD